MNGIRLALAACAAVAVLGARETGAVGVDPETPAIDVQKFSEIEWPFGLDQWGRGRAFRCAAADCAVEVSVYVRAKIGFCNCTTGVSDDAELDRVGDVSLLSDAFVPMRTGQPVIVGWMHGRMRLFDAAPRYANKQNALAVAFNDQCDVIVATVMSGRTVPPQAERAALAFLNSDTVLQWARKELGL